MSGFGPFFPEKKEKKMNLISRRKSYKNVLQVILLVVREFAQKLES
jgi:hypothetical protein